MGRADLHIHTTYSKDGLANVEEVLEFAEKQAELDVIAVTDHDRIDGAVEAVRQSKNRRIEVIVGEEVSSRSGHVLGLFLTEPIPPALSLEETIRRIHEQDGLAVIPHPLWSLYVGVPVPRRGRVRVGMSGVSRASMARLLRKDREVWPDGVEVYNASPNGYIPHREVARLNRTRWQLPEVGGSDAHLAAMVGTAYTVFPGRTAADLRKALENGHTEAEGSFISARIMLRFAAGHIRRRAEVVRSRRLGAESHDAPS